MAMINCPECGTRISDSATACPYCGFKLTKNAIAKLERNSLSNTKKQALSFFAFGNDEDIFLSRENIDTMETVHKLFSDAKTLSQIAPSLFETVREMFPETKLVADLTPEIQKLLKSKDFAMATDKDGKLMAVIRTVKGKKTFKKQIRLVEMSFHSNLMPAIINLQTQIALAKIIASLGKINETLSSIKTDIQDGRMALAESCVQQVKQAELIKDSRIREAKLLEITSKSAEARCLLGKTIYRQCEVLKKIWKEDKNSFVPEQLVFVKDTVGATVDAVLGRGDNNSTAAENVFTSLSAVIKCVESETESYCLLGEQNASAEVINQFKDLIKNNHLEDKEFLKLINSFSQKNYMPLINNFITGCKQFLQLCSDESVTNLLQERPLLLLPGSASVPMVIK